MPESVTTRPDPGDDTVVARLSPGNHPGGTAAEWFPADVVDQVFGTPAVVCQPRCVFCGIGHYAPAVPAVSRGKAGCHNCGRVPPVFHSEDEYRAAVRAARERTIDDG